MLGAELAGIGSSATPGPCGPGCLLLIVARHNHVDGRLRRGRGEQALLAAFVEDVLHVARFVVGEQRDDLVPEGVSPGHAVCGRKPRRGMTYALYWRISYDLLRSHELAVYAMSLLDISGARAAQNIRSFFDTNGRNDRTKRMT